jgi:hypothetical protein
MKTLFNASSFLANYGKNMKRLANSLNAIAGVSRTFALCAAIFFVHVSTAWAQPSSVEIEHEQARKELGSARLAQESKMDDSFLIKNNDHFSICIKNSDGTESKLLACLSESVKKLDGYLSRLMIRIKLDEKTDKQFFESRNFFCLKVTDDFDGTNQTVVYADCLRIRTVAEIIKKSHSVENIDGFLLLLFTQKKLSLVERENFFNNRKYFCEDAKKFRSDFSENLPQAEYFYENCLNTRAVEEILKRLH